MAGPAAARGTITITNSTGGSLLLCADIAGYSVNWRPRKRVFNGLGGTVTEQDFGRYKGNLVWTARSAGLAGYIASSEVVFLDAIVGTRGGTPTYTDSLGSSGTVSLLDFQHTREHADLFSWTLPIRVVTLNYFMGSTYGGS